ncbi:ABC transporter permease [Peribacillus sp. SCS-26]|uniref:ABC transporter permease n=1 Tax=Paraperibacillus marinus TaxID=3115295 RepID=UPI0039069082
MADIFWLIRFTLIRTFRLKKNIVLFLLLPLAGIFIALLAYGGNQKAVLHLGIVMEDKSRPASDAAAFLSGLDNVSAERISRSDTGDELTSGRLDSVITIEDGYGDSILAGTPGQVSITSIKGAEAVAYIKAYLEQHMKNAALLGKASAGDAEVFNNLYRSYQDDNFKLTSHALLDTSKNKGMTNQSLGFLIMIMLISAGSLSEIILDEKTKRTYYRLISTPINARKYILSNIIVNLMVMAVQILITLIFMTGVFHIKINFPVWEAGAVLLLFALIAIGLSLVTVAIAKNRSTSGALHNLIVMPTVMLSGCYWPVEVMPEGLQRLAEFLPQRWALASIEKLQTGAPFFSLYLHFTILFSFAAAFFLIAVYLFGRNNDVRSFL